MGYSYHRIAVVTYSYCTGSAITCKVKRKTPHNLLPNPQSGLGGYKTTAEAADLPTSAANSAVLPTLYTKAATLQIW